MAIDLPTLDDIDYDDLLAPAVASIPALCPGWTNYNASDPGITLIELFAWLTDMVIYRTDRIPPQTYDAFLRLLNGPGYQRSGSIDDAIAATLAGLQEVYRAVTPADYELLTKGAFVDEQREKGQPLCIERVQCIGDQTGRVRLVVVPGGDDPAAPWLAPSKQLAADLVAFFEDRRLVTTRISTDSIEAPDYVDINIDATIYVHSDAVAAETAQQARTALFEYFHPWPDPGGQDFPLGKRARASGWPFGRTVYAPEVMRVLAAVPGVAFVTDVKLTTDAERKVEFVPSSIGPTGLPRVYRTSIAPTPKALTGSMGQRGTTWQ